MGHNMWKINTNQLNSLIYGDDMSMVYIKAAVSSVH